MKTTTNTHKPVWRRQGREVPFSEWKHIYHTGPVGLTVGDVLLPAAQTGIHGLVTVATSKVYFTPDPLCAIIYAWVYQNRLNKQASVYFVRPEGEVTPDQEEEFVQFCADRATVVGIDIEEVSPEQIRHAITRVFGRYSTEMSTFKGGGSLFVARYVKPLLDSWEAFDAETRRSIAGLFAPFSTIRTQQ